MGTGSITLSHTNNPGRRFSMFRFLIGVAFGAAGYWAWQSFGRDLLGMGSDQEATYGGFSASQPASGASSSSGFSSPSSTSSGSFSSSPAAAPSGSGPSSIGSAENSDGGSA